MALWRDVMTALGKEYADVALDHLEPGALNGAAEPRPREVHAVARQVEVKPARAKAPRLPPAEVRHGHEQDATRLERGRGPAEVRDRVLEAARFIDPAHLGTTDDCGFSPFGDDTSTSRDTAFAKIRARVEGTDMASRKLGA